MLGEDGATTPVPLGEDDFVEQLDGRILGTSGFTLVYEFIEHLRFAHHSNVFSRLAGYTADELIHVEVIHHACFSALTRSGMHEATVSVEQRGKAADENSTYSLRAECEGTDDRDLVKTAWVYVGVASTTAIDAILAFLVANAAVHLVFAWTPDQAMTLNPFGSFGVSWTRRLNCGWHDGRSGKSRRCID